MSSKVPQTVRISVSGPLHTLVVGETPHTMSWSTSKVGFASCTLLTHDKARWVSLTLVECPHGGRRTQTMMTLHEAAARAVYTRLHALFGSGPAPAPDAATVAPQG